MYRRFILLLALFTSILILTGSLSWAHEAGWPGKRLAQVFPKAKDFKKRQVTLSAAQIARVEKATGSKLGVEDKSPTFYIAYGVVESSILDEGSKSDEVKPIGAVIFIDTVGARGKMEVNVAISTKGKLYSVSFWKNKEGKKLENKEFLKQFNAKKKSTDPFLVGKDITAAPGAKKASQATATAAKKSWLMFQEVFGKKKTEASTADAHHDDEGDDDHDNSDGHHDDEGDDDHDNSDGHHDEEDDDDHEESDDHHDEEDDDHHEEGEHH